MEERPTPAGATPEAAAATPQQPPGTQPAQRPARPEPAPAGALSDRGKAVAISLQRIASPYALQSGGRDDIPWVEVQPEHLVTVAGRCKEDPQLQMEMLHCLLGVDYQTHIQVIYILYSLTMNQKAMLKVNLDPNTPRVASVSPLWEAASWFERETHDLFGVEFEGSPNMKPLILYEGFPGFPGRRSFPLHEYKEY